MVNRTRDKGDYYPEKVRNVEKLGSALPEWPYGLRIYFSG
jgi:hypothetical protein